MVIEKGCKTTAREAGVDTAQFSYVSLLNLAIKAFASCKQFSQPLGNKSLPDLYASVNRKGLIFTDYYGRLLPLLYMQERQLRLSKLLKLSKR
jgi:hypothetical protein